MQATLPEGLSQIGWDVALLSGGLAQAKCLVEIGGGDPAIRAVLKEQVPGRKIHTLDCRLHPVAGEPNYLDCERRIDIEQEDIPLPLGSVDVLMYKDSLNDVKDPLSVLRRHRHFLTSTGFMLCSVLNDLDLDPSFGLGEHDRANRFTYAAFTKLLLDAGYASEVLLTVPVRTYSSHELALSSEESNGNAIQEVAYQFIFRGWPIDYLGKPRQAAHDRPLTFVVCVSNDSLLRANLLSSPCFATGSPHELLLMRGCPSAAAGLNRGLEQAQNEYVVCVHQDVYLPEGWPERLWQQLELLDTRKPADVLGVYGVGRHGADFYRAGHVVDRRHLLVEPVRLPAVVETLDELLLVVRKNAGLRFDEQLGFHFYGADICQQAHRRGAPAMCIDAICFHNSKSSTELPPEFFSSGRIFAEKWADRLPITTSCARVDEDWLGSPG
jgi:hypothetical protein